MRIIPIEGLNAIAWTLATADILLVIGRLLLHWRKNRRFGWDDYLNALALVFLLVFFITYQLYVPIEYNAQLYALGMSDTPPTERNIVLDMKLNVANTVMFWCVIYTVKASFLALYWQLFQVLNRFRLYWWLMAVYTILTFLITIPSYFWSCGAPKDFFNLEVCNHRPRQRTVSILVMWCVLNVLGDLFLMILPVAMLRNMFMKTPQKIGIYVVFSLVLIIIAFDILRTVFTLRMKPEFGDENAIWTTLEPAIAVMVCTLPCYRGLLSWGASSPFSSFIFSFRGFSNTSESEIAVNPSRSQQRLPITP